MGDSQHIQNIQVNKVPGENKECTFYFMEKINRLFDQPNKMLEVKNKKRIERTKMAA